MTDRRQEIKLGTAIQKANELVQFAGSSSN
jgi:hypothetical protein